MTVVDDEFGQVQPVLRCSENLSGTSYWVRRLERSQQYDVVLKQLADRGNLASQEAATELIEDFRPHYLLLVGIGGGMHGRDGTDVGDVIVVDYVEYYEFRKLTRGRSLSRKIPFDHPSKLLRADVAKPLVDRRLWTNSISVPRPVAGTCKGVVGNLIAGDKLLADLTNETQRSLLDEYDKAVGVDMESGGVARAVYSARASIHYNLQYAVLRGVSDLVDVENNQEMREQWRPYAASAAAALAGQMIETLLALPR